MAARRILIDCSYAAFWRDLMEGISLFVRERRHDWQLHCVVAADFAAGLAQRPDGILSVLSHDARLLSAVRDSRIPAVNLLRDVQPALPSVVTHNQAVGERAAEYFLARGFRHFGFLGVERPWSTARLQGFRDFLAHRGHTLHESMASPLVQELRAVRSRKTMRQLQRWARRLPNPVAVLAASDFIARALLEACREADIRVPQQLAILGVDNEISICEFSPVTLSSIPQNLARIGFEGARLLEGLMSGRRAPRRPLLVSPREIVVRRSTDVIAVEEPLVARALELIHRPAAPGSGLPDVKQLRGELKVSRQWLDRQFKATLGRTVSGEIREERLLRARRMLLETRIPVRAVAQQCGFRHPENFCRFFRDRTGVSPSAFRGRGA